MPQGVNALHSDWHTLAIVQDEVPATRFWHCKNLVIDIFMTEQKREIPTTEHNRAHRVAQENVKQVLFEYYFPKMATLANEIVQNCKTCVRAMYDIHPRKQEITESPTAHTGEMLHIDVFSTDKILSHLHLQVVQFAIVQLSQDSFYSSL